MPNFVMASRRSNTGIRTFATAISDEESTTLSFRRAVDTLKADHPRVELKFEASTRRQKAFIKSDLAEIEEIRRRMPSDLIIEPEIKFDKQTQAPFDLLKASPLDLVDIMNIEPLEEAGAGLGTTLTVHVQGRRQSNEDLVGAEVHVFLAGPAGLRDRTIKRTDDQGRAEFSFASFYRVLTVITVPYSGFWPKIQRGSPGRSLKITCSALPKDGAGEWWHRSVGLNADLKLGASNEYGAVKIGIVDSGCGPHPALAHVKDCGAYIQGRYEDKPGSGLDSGSHGTHVCGTVGSRMLPFFGVAPAADLYSVRVFPPTGSANQLDIAAAIDDLVENRKVHLINMSLGAAESSQILEDAIANAADNGIVCICAAGNEAGPIVFPASSPATIAVSAIGKLGFVPLDGLAAIPSNPVLFGSSNLHAADFTNHGDDMQACSPGVGIIAPVPQKYNYQEPFVAMNGTSMASPIACARLAIALASDEAYHLLPSDRMRTRYAKAVFRAMCRSIGLPREYEGNGLIGGEESLV